MFDIRPYAKAELASLYSPHVAPDSAMKTLKRWIKGSPCWWKNSVRCAISPIAIRS